LKDSQNTIPFYKPRKINNEQFYARAENIFDSCQFTNAGPNVLELEKRIAEFHNVKYCIAVCNATIGLQLVLKGLDLTGEVITTPFTFIATAHAIMWQGLTPVFADIDSETLTISPDQIEKSITPKTSAIMGVHVFGQPCQVDRISKIGQKHGLKIVYDAAHSFMTYYRGVPIGSFGDAEVLSFHATKLFHTFEGGAILTNDSTLANKLRLLKNFGFKGIDWVDYLGINGKMNEISAAYGLNLLPYIPETIKRLKHIQDLYRSSLKEIKGISFLKLGNDVVGNGQYMVVFIDQKIFGISRDQLWAYLWKNGVQTRRYFYPGVHMCEPYFSHMPWFRDALPVTKQIAERVLCLPCYYDLSDGDIERACQLLNQAVTHVDRIRAWYEELLNQNDHEPHLNSVVESLTSIR